MVPYWSLLKSELDSFLQAHINELPYPVFVKPANLGSSVGITKAHCAEERIVSGDDPRVFAAERREECHRVGESRMVRDDKERTSRRDVLAPFDGEPAGRFVDDPRGAVTQSGLAERAVVRDEAAGDVIRDRSDEPAHDCNA